jgi:hypothetical protein
MTIDGPLLFLDHLFEIVLCLALVLLCAGVGRHALDRAGIDFADSLEALVFATATGAGVVGSLLLVFGLVGGLRPIPLGLLMVALALWERNYVREVLGLVVDAARDLRRAASDESLTLLAIGIFGCVAVLLIVIGAAPPVDWDSLMYQIQIPAEFLREGRIHVPEDNLHVSRIGLASFLYLPLLAAGSSAAPAILSGLLASILGLAVYSFCMRFSDRPTAALSLGSLWGTTSILLVAVTPRVDVTLTLFSFLATYALLNAHESRDKGHLLLAAALLGFGIGVKFHALPYIVAVAPLMVWTGRSLGGSRSQSLSLILFFGLVVLAAALPWLAKNWVLLSAPLYPFFSARLLDPWLVPLYGSPFAPKSIDPDVFYWIWDLRRPINVRDMLLAPGRLTIEAEGRHYLTNPFLLALPLWFFFRRNSVTNWLIVTAILYFVVVLIPFPRTNLRYFIPALVPLAIAGCHLTASLARRALSPYAARIALAAVLVLALVPSTLAVDSWWSRSGTVSHFFGATSRATYLHRNARPLAEMTSRINQRLPEDSRILMLFDARGFYFERDVIQDNLVANLPLVMARWDGRSCLGDAGVTHMLLNTGALGYYRGGGLDLNLVRWREFERFREHCLELVDRNASFELYMLSEQPIE